MTTNVNNQSDWERMISAPSFDVQSYQEKIDAICGLNSLGKPNIKLTWMPAPENWSKYYVEWDEGGFGTKSEPVPMYRDESGFPPERWALKQWLPGGQYAATDDFIRWKKREVGRQVEVRETRPRLPIEGYYIPHPSPAMNIGLHDGKCCREAYAAKQKCFGEYRDPDEAYLELLRQAVAVRSREGYQNPDAPLSEETLRQAAREAEWITEQRKAEARKRTEAFVDENWNELVETFTGESALKIQTGYRQTKGGIILPC